MSDSVRPHRRQPTGLPHPWDSPGKNTGVGCHFLLQCMKVKRQRWSRSVMSDLATSWLQPTRLLHPWDFPGKSTGVGCHCLLRYICMHIAKYIYIYLNMYVYIFSVSHSFPLYFITRYWIYLPLLHRRTLLLSLLCMVVVSCFLTVECILTFPTWFKIWEKFFDEWT